MAINFFKKSREREISKSNNENKSLLIDNLIITTERKIKKMNSAEPEKKRTKTRVI